MSQEQPQLQGVAGLKKHDIKVSGIVFMLYCLVAAGAFGIEEPLKKLTLPRLELCAAALGAELTTRVRKELQFENNQTYLWSDSEIVLYWINSPSSSLHTFVANRISKIHGLTINTQWRHVSSKQNPADLISRGLSPEKLSTCTLWFYGPIFLHGKEGQWPKNSRKLYNLQLTWSLSKKRLLPLLLLTQD